MEGFATIDPTQPVWMIVVRVVAAVCFVVATLVKVKFLSDIPIVYLARSRAALAFLSILRLTLYLVVLGLGALVTWGVLCLPFISFAKLILVIVMVSFSLLALTITLSAGSLTRTLAEAETQCEDLRDLTMFQATVTRTQLAETAERLRKRGEPEPETDLVADLVASALPVAMMLLQKERSLVKWGLTAFNVGRRVWNKFQQQKN